MRDVTVIRAPRPLLRSRGKGRSIPHDPDRVKLSSVPGYKRARSLVLARDKRVCQYCGAPAETVDHVKPRWMGGDVLDTRNMVACCWPCQNPQDRSRGAGVHSPGLRGTVNVLQSRRGVHSLEDGAAKHRVRRGFPPLSGDKDAINTVTADYSVDKGPNPVIPEGIK